MATKLNPDAIQDRSIASIKLQDGVIPSESTVSGWGFTKNAGTITGITMNGASKGTSGVVNLGTVITDVSGKADSSAAIGTLSLSINSSNYQITLSGTKVDGTTFTVSDVIDLPLESVVVSGSYDDTTQKVILTLKNGSTIDFSIADLIDGLQSEITSSNKLSADLIEDGTTNKTVTATEKQTWNSYANVQADWEQDTTTEDDYILNKPSIKAGTGTNSIISGDLTKNTASGTNSHAEGYATSALVDYSHAEGQAVFVNGNGRAAHAEGAGNNANGYASHAEGGFTYAGDSYSHAEGYHTISIGDKSHAEGNGSSGTNSTFTVSGAANAISYTTNVAHNLKIGDIVGYGTTTNKKISTVTGISNDNLGFSLLETISKEQLSNVSIKIYSSGAVGEASHSEGNNTTSTGSYSHAEGDNTVTNGSSSHAEGYSTTANGSNSHAEGSSTTANGSNSHAEGNNSITIPNGFATHAEGNYTVAAGERSHAEGNGSPVSGYIEAPFKLTGQKNTRFYTTDTLDGVYRGMILYYSGAYGVVNNFFDDDGDLEIDLRSNESLNPDAAITNATVYIVPGSGGVGSHSEGVDTIAAGDYSHAEGDRTLAVNSFEHAQGHYNKSNKVNNTFGNSGNTLNSIGIGTSESTRKNAVEVMQNGDVYVYGVGDYDGTNPTTADTLQDAINNASMDLAIPITYSELVTLKTGGNLVPGMQYRITDYNCTTTQANTQCAGHVFDIIVTADSATELNENARAAHHSGDTYFQNCDLDSWELKYSLENDTNRFVWADTTNGKGVIYYMKDEWNNIAPFDFKNMLFTRNTSWFNSHQTWATNVLGSVPSTNMNFYFLSWVTQNNEVQDLSIVGQTLMNDNGGYSGVCNNEIKETTAYYMGITEDATSTAFALPCTIIVSSYAFDEGLFYGCYGNSFWNECYYNSFGNCFNYNTFENFCYENSFGNFCYHNSFGNNYYYNSFGNSCYENSFGNSCYENSFGNGCAGNTFGNDCFQNSFGNNCQFNSFRNDCFQNSFGNRCYENSFGNNYSLNTFGNYLQTITVFDGVIYCSVTGGSQSAPIKNAQILNGTKGASSSNKLTITFTANQNYTQVAGLVNGTDLRIWIAEDTVTGPSTSTGNNLAAFDGTTGKVIKDSGVALSSLSNLVHTTGNETITGKKTFTTNTDFKSGVSILNSSGTVGTYMISDTTNDGKLGFYAAQDDSAVQLQNIATPTNNSDAANKSYVDGQVATKYTKPSGGIPSTDLAQAVQTSLGLADTALQSYTETDPIFTASAAHGITSSDITNWNNKTSNVGTITGITMNGASKGTSGVVNLGTVITSETALSKGTTTGSGNAVTDISVNGHEITLTKGTTFLTEETDPVFGSSAAASITSSQINAWDAKVSANNGTLTIQKNGTQVATFSANQTTNQTANIQVNELPSVSASDNGKILMVVNGAWSLVTPVSIYSGTSTPDSSLGDNGDLYIQTNS